MKHEDRAAASELAAIHTPEAIRRRMLRGPDHSYLRDFIYGAIDGSVTTFAVVAGVAGAQLSAEVVIILGAANLIGDGFSMAAGNFLGTRAELQQIEHARAAEREHIEHVPEGEREEIRQIFATKGFHGRDLDRAVEIITSDHDQWVEMMLREELGMAVDVRSPWRAAAATFCAFIVCGLIPLVPYAIQIAIHQGIQTAFLPSTLLTGMVFFTVGALKSRFVSQHWLHSGLETLFVGGMAASLAYGVGVLLKHLGL